MHFGLRRQQTWVLTLALPSCQLWTLMGKLLDLSDLSSPRWKVGLTGHLAGFLGKFNKVMLLTRLAKCQAQCKYLTGGMLLTRIFGWT